MTKFPYIVTPAPPKPEWLSQCPLCKRTLTQVDSYSCPHDKCPVQPKPTC